MKTAAQRKKLNKGFWDLHGKLIKDVKDGKITIAQGKKILKEEAIRIGASKEFISRLK